MALTVTWIGLIHVHVQMATTVSSSSGSSGSPTVLPTANEVTRPRAGNRLPAVLKALQESDDGNLREAIRSPGKAIRVLRINDETNALVAVPPPPPPPGHELPANSPCELAKLLQLKANLR